MAIREVPPLKCRMWAMHERLGDDVNAGTCALLIDSVRRHGQKQPVLGRPIRDSQGYVVELIYGSRRLFAAMTLGRGLLVDIRNIDDRAALIEMDIENRLRKDISPYERGLSYRRWLRAGQFRNQAEVARALGVSEAQICRLLRFADLPSVVVRAFAAPRDIREEWAARLAKMCADPARREAVVRRARYRVQSVQQLPPQAIYEVLIGGHSRDAVRRRAHDEVVAGSRGAPLLRIGVRAKTIHLILARDKINPRTLQRITDEVRNVLENEELVGDAVHQTLRSPTSSLVTFETLRDAP
jgi:ParB family transcriptional regulator, chromosome partitioning protein